MNKNTIIANCVTVGGVGLMLGIAQLALLPSALIMSGTIGACIYLTKKEAKKEIKKEGK